MIVFTSCRVDGGVSNNNFLVQMMADLTNRQVDRPKHIDMASLGAAFLAGLAVGEYDHDAPFTAQVWLNLKP